MRDPGSEEVAIFLRMTPEVVLKHVHANTHTYEHLHIYTDIHSHIHRKKIINFKILSHLSLVYILL